MAERLRPGKRREAVLFAWGIDEEGKKHLIHLAPGTKEDTERKNVIPYRFFGKTLRQIFGSIIAQIVARDVHQTANKPENERFNSKLAESIVGIEKSVFQLVCTDENNGSAFDNVHIFEYSDSLINYVGI